MFQILKKISNHFSSDKQENDLSKIDYTKDVIDMSKFDYVKDVITMSDDKVFTDNQNFSQTRQTQNAPKYTTIYPVDVLKQHTEELENESKNIKNKDNQITVNRVQTGKVTPTFEKQKDGLLIAKGKKSDFAKHEIDTWGYLGDFEDEKDTWGAIT